ncbi:MAG: hypothetical protein Q7S06_01175 [Nanoarchaeota archaeon]|nr:hypothetical protein [Nanoarchaeota archaeon]
MAKRSLRGALALGALALAGNAYSEGAQELYSQDSEKITTINNTSIRPSYKGLVLPYDVRKDLSVTRTDEPQTEFLPRWYYDRNGNGVPDADDGDPMYMGNEFDKTVRNIYIKQMNVDQLGTQLEQPGLLTDEYNSLKAKYDSAMTELTNLRGKLSQLESTVDEEKRTNNPAKSVSTTDLDTLKVETKAEASAETGTVASREYAQGNMVYGNYLEQARFQQKLEEQLREVYSRLSIPTKSVNADNSERTKVEMVLPEVPLVGYVHEEGNPKETRVVTSTYSPKAPKAKRNAPIEIILGARIVVPTYTLQNEQEVREFNLAHGLYGGELGIKIGKYFGLTGNISAGLDRRVTDVKEAFDEVMFPGIYGITKGDMTKFLSLGISAEGYIPFSDFFSWLISLGINTQSSTYTVENSKTGPSGIIGVPSFDKPKDNRLISLSAATGAELKFSDGIRASALVGAQVPFKQDAKNLDGTWSNNPAGIDFSKITPSLALRIAILLNGGN